MIFFWLSAFPDDCKHEKESSLKTRRHKLAIPPWMQSRLLENRIGQELPPRCIIALGKGHFRGVWSGPLTQMAVEETLLWKFWHFPTDAWFIGTSAVVSGHQL